MKVGSGDFTYERVSTWPKMPKYWRFGECSDAAVNSHGEIYVLSRGDDHPVTIWDTEGNFISSWGEGTFSACPHGIYIAPSDNVWIVDRDYHIATEYTPAGKPLKTLGLKLSPSPTCDGKFVHSRPFNMPANLAIAPNGEIFVADGYAAHRVHKFSSAGELLLSWGRQGIGPGEFALVHNIWIDRSGRVFVSDCENDRIQVFDADGKFLEERKVENPTGLCIRDDIVYIAQLQPSPNAAAGPGWGAVSIWDLDGKMITRWTGNQGPGRDLMIGPHDLCVGSDDSIYVCETAGARVSKFRRVTA